MYLCTKFILMQKQGSTKWRSPSNIAIVKYWGKYGNQLPRNPSLSFSLSSSYTTTQVDFDYDEERNEFELEFSFEGKEAPKFKTRILHYFEKNIAEFPYLPHLKLNIQSGNSFPHSAGIASSASAMSALALCMCSIETRLNGPFPSKQLFRLRASHLARLASGSAARSVFGGLAAWGESESIADSSNEFAVPVNEGVDPIFLDFCDSIAIVDAGEKAVSSSVGHNLMKEHPYAEMRYFVARQHLEQLKDIMEQGDVDAFGEILENEALALHGLMMNSKPSFILMKPNTLKIIEIIRTIRKERNLSWYFTLDAGPNVHILYPQSIEKTVRPLIDELIAPLCQNKQVIHDQVGNGPKQLINQPNESASE